MISRFVYNAVWLKCNAQAWFASWSLPSPEFLLVEGYYPILAEDCSEWLLAVRKGKLHLLPQN
eukprot:6491735-Amphidinium_carterae.6